MHDYIVIVVDVGFSPSGVLSSISLHWVLLVWTFCFMKGLSPGCLIKCTNLHSENDHSVTLVCVKANQRDHLLKDKNSYLTAESKGKQVVQFALCAFW